MQYIMNVEQKDVRAKTIQFFGFPIGMLDLDNRIAYLEEQDVVNDRLVQARIFRNDYLDLAVPVFHYTMLLVGLREQGYHVKTSVPEPQRSPYSGAIEHPLENHPGRYSYEKVLDMVYGNPSERKI